MSEMQDAFEAEKANSDKAFDMYIEAQATIEAQSKLIEELREAFRAFLYEAPSTLSCGRRCQLETEQEEEEAYMAAYANAEFALAKANPHSEKVE